MCHNLTLSHDIDKILIFMIIIYSLEEIIKYCSHCGAEIMDEAVICVKCGCPVSNAQAVGVVNPDDAPSGGFAVLGFFFPLVGLILWLFWNNSSPKKAKSCGKGALIGVIIIPIITIAFSFILVFVTTTSFTTLNILNKGGKEQTSESDASSPNADKRPIYSYYRDIGSITIRTMDPVNHSVTVVMNLGFDQNDTATSSELTSRQLELRDFVRNYFMGKYASELQPENEAKLKQDILETLNTSFLNTGRVRIVLFDKLDVMEVF
jgi:flagellar FliL protein